MKNYCNLGTKNSWRAWNVIPVQEVKYLKISIMLAAQNKTWNSFKILVNDKNLLSMIFVLFSSFENIYENKNSIINDDCVRSFYQVNLHLKKKNNTNRLPWEHWVQRIQSVYGGTDKGLVALKVQQYAAMLSESAMDSAAFEAFLQYFECVVGPID